MSKKALIILADGFEETEATVPIDILRRAEVDVTVAGLDGEMIAGAHGLSLVTDILFDEYSGMPDVVIFPGGMPGAENLANSIKVKDMVLKMNKEGRLVAAICASPALVLGPTGILNGKTATCYPGMEESFSPEVTFSSDAVVQDGNIITSRGPATAFSFGLKIAENLVGKEKAEMVGKGMLYLK